MTPSHLINNWQYCDSYIRLLMFNEVVSTARCWCNQWSEHSLLYGSQFQDCQNYFKYVLSQLSLLNLV